MQFKNKLTLIILAACISSSLITRGQDRRAAIQYFLQAGFDFNYSPVKILEPDYQTHATICDTSGLLLLKQVGDYIVDNKNGIIGNSKGIYAYSVEYDGRPIFVRVNDKVWLFNFDTTVIYSVITQDKEKGTWFVSESEKNRDLYSSTYTGSSCLIDAIEHTDGNKFWIRIRKDAEDLTFLLDSSGIKLADRQKAALNDGYPYFINAYAISTLGDLLVYCQKNNLEFDNFDKEKGVITQSMVYTYGREIIEGAVFSPDSHYLYFRQNTFLYQLPVKDGIPDFNNIEVISTHTRYVDPVTLYLTQGLDGKIYHYIPNTKTISVIDSPNEKGSLCNFREDTIQLKTLGWGNFPNFPHYNKLEIPVITAQNLCSADNTIFGVSGASNIISTCWDLGDGCLSNELSPKHNYKNSGKYLVIATLRFKNKTSKGIMKEVFIQQSLKTIEIKHD